ncbi:MAG: HAMP domain-containing sensor histidine kinase [Cyclobacteriaceae bacterium]|nr:HAMP domain-containing sensor histidine kinase [Cyclobacteriaceae bacterium]
MIWCAIFIYPAFGLLDYLLIANWIEFLLVRLLGVLLLGMLLIYDSYAKVKPEVLAHISTQVVINSLMWMLSQIDNPQTFSIYTINSCTGYVASALFLFWKPVNSVVLLTLNLSFFSLFITFYSPLSWTEVLVNGSFLLFTVGLMAQFYTYYRCKVVLSDFKVQQQLNGLNTELWTKNYQIEKQSAEISKKNNDLVELNSLKDRLFVIISHDLRAPLLSLKGVLDLISKSSSISPDEFRFLTRGIKVKVDVTYNLMENLLYWTRRQMTGFNVRPITISIKEVIQDCVNLLETVADKKRITIINETSSDHFVRADIDMIRLVVRNLIMNAIKFSFENGSVFIKSRRENHEIIISIIDTGTGMAEEESQVLFNKTQNNSKVGTSKEEGTGLGLMLCKEFIEMNDGRIWVVTEQGLGSEFNFSLKSQQIVNREVPLNTLMKETG